MKRIAKYLLAMVLLIFAFFILPVLIGDWPRMNFQKHLRARTTSQELQAWVAAA